jgi:hypothetical protein
MCQYLPNSLDRKHSKLKQVFLISNFRRVLNLLKYFLFIQPLKMDLTEGSETSAKHNLTPGKHPKEHIQNKTGLSDVAITTVAFQTEICYIVSTTRRS